MSSLDLSDLGLDPDEREPQVNFKIRGDGIEPFEFYVNDSEFKELLDSNDVLIQRVINKMPGRNKYQRKLRDELSKAYSSNTGLDSTLGGSTEAPKKNLRLMHRGKLVVDNGTDLNKYKDPVTDKIKAIELKDIKNSYLSDPENPSSTINPGMLALTAVIVKPKRSNSNVLNLLFTENTVNYRPRPIGHETSPFIRFIGAKQEKQLSRPFTSPWFEENMHIVDEAINTIGLASKGRKKTKKVLKITIDEIQRSKEPVEEIQVQTEQTGGVIKKRNTTRKRKY